MNSSESPPIAVGEARALVLRIDDDLALLSVFLSVILSLKLLRGSGLVMLDLMDW